MKPEIQKLIDADIKAKRAFDEYKQTTTVCKHLLKNENKLTKPTEPENIQHECSNTDTKPQRKCSNWAEAIKAVFELKRKQGL